MRTIQKIIIALIVLLVVGGAIDLYIVYRSNQGAPSETGGNELINQEPENIPGPPPPPEPPKDESGSLKIMEIASPAFNNNQMIPMEYTCDGENVSPPLTIDNVPKETESLVLIVDDPDAPGGTWVHWTLWNMPPDIREISRNSYPDKAVQGVTSFGSAGYGGPCPPSGTHRYFFKLFALNTTLALDSQTRADELEKAMEGHILAQSQLVGLYRRQ